MIGGKKLISIVDEFFATYHFPVKLEIENSSPLTVHPDIQPQIIHIVKEALSNVQRHSQATQAWVKAKSVNGYAHFIIEDDGKGFDPKASMEGNHFGLRIMKTRAERSGGEFTLSSHIGEGTQIFVKFPVAISEQNEKQSLGENL